MSEPGVEARRRALGGLLLVLALTGAAIVHWPALHSDFRHDDWLTFYQAANLRPLDFILLPHAGHLMMTRNAVHLAFFELFDLDAFPYFVAAVATHLVNVALLFLLALRLTRSSAIAAFAAALWGMAPVQQASVNWVALYGNMLVATFLLWPLVELAALAAERRPASAWALARWGLCLAAAATSFGPGFAGALAFPVAAWLLLPPESARTRAALALGAVALLLVAVYLAVRPSTSFELADGSLSTFGLPLVVRAFFGLCSYGIAALLGGPWLTFAEGGVPYGPLRGLDSTPLVHVSWALAALVCGAIAWAWWRARARERRQMLGLLLLIAAIHGLLAVARALPGVWLIGIDNLIVTARYQYVATALWSACFALALVELTRVRAGWKAPAWLAPAALATWIAVTAVPNAWVARQIDWNATAWSREALEAERHWFQQQIEAAGPGREVRIVNRLFEGMKMMQPLISAREFPGSAAVFLLLQHNAPQAARDVKFIESDRAVVDHVRAQPHAKMAELLLTPEEAAQHAAAE